MQKKFILTESRFVVKVIFWLFLGGKVFVMPDVAEQDENGSGTPGADMIDDVFVSEGNKVENKTHQREEKAEKSEEISEKRSMVPAEEIKSPTVNTSEEMHKTKKQEPGESATEYASKTEEDGEIPSAVHKNVLNEDTFAIQAKEELDKKEKAIESSWDSPNVDKTDRRFSDKNGELVMVNGVHEDLSPTETPEKAQVDSKPELVTVKEGYSLVAPKQKVAFAKEGDDDTVINDSCSSPNEGNTGQRENGYKQEGRLNDQVSSLLPVEIEDKERDLNTFESKSTTKQNDREKTETSSTSATQVDDSNRKIKTSLELSDIPVAFNRPEVRNDPKLIRLEGSQEREPKKSGKISAERPQALQNTALSENGGKTEVANQSQSIKKSLEVEDDNPWILQLPQGGDQGSRERSEQKRNNNSNRRTEHKQEDKQSEIKDKQALVLPTVTIDQSDKLSVDRNREHPLEELSESGEEHTEEVEPRRTSESDLSGLRPLSPLSPLMEDQESNSTFLHPSGAQATKVKRNKSFMARGFSKMFGSKRKYKVDKERKDTTYSSESDNRMAHEEFDFRENHNTEKKEKKKKKKERSEKKSDEQSTDEHGADKKSSRKFGGLFSRGKKKEKQSH